MRTFAGERFPSSIFDKSGIGTATEASATTHYSTTMTDKTFRLVTVNTAPERAKRLIGRVVEDVKDKYTIVYVANVESKRAPFQTSSRLSIMR